VAKSSKVQTPGGVRSAKSANAVGLSTLFVDIGGVLLSDGWGRRQRERAIAEFGLDGEDFSNRHLQIWNSYQLGKCSLDDYFERVLFYRPQSFSRAALKAFMFAQSTPCPDMLDLVGRLKRKWGLKVVVVSNEGRELNAHRIHTFQLDRLADIFVSSCYVQRLKPDPGIFRLALDLAQVSPSEVVYIENTAMFVEVARGFGIQAVVHKSFTETRMALAQLGLGVDDAARAAAPGGRA
jgi:putative hydrolase of the HAD superfamily